MSTKYKNGKWKFTKALTTYVKWYNINLQWFVTNMHIYSREQPFFLNNTKRYSWGANVGKKKSNTKKYSNQKNEKREEKRNRKQMRQMKVKSKMIHLTTTIITLSINGLSALIKRQRFLNYTENKIKTQL